MPHHGFKTIFPVLSLFMSAPAIPAAERTPRTDARLQATIERELGEDAPGVQVDVEDGNVTLRGTVRTLYDRQRAADLVQKVHGVGSVRNELAVARADSDAGVAEEVAAQVRHYAYFGIFDDVSVQVRDGVVTLTGRVTAPFKAEDLARMAARVPGAQDVRDEVEALPSSTFDDQLRHALASAIYNDPLFFRYATDPAPPIHIVVENGEVTLTGAVGSAVEKSKAEMVARSIPGVMGVEDQLRVE